MVSIKINTPLIFIFLVLFVLSIKAVDQSGKEQEAAPGPTEYHPRHDVDKQQSTDSDDSKNIALQPGKRILNVDLNSCFIHRPHCDHWHNLLPSEKKSASSRFYRYKQNINSAELSEDDNNKLRARRKESDRKRYQKYTDIRKKEIQKKNTVQRRIRLANMGTKEREAWYRKNNRYRQTKKKE